jgi:hypothetical protein
MKHFAQRFFFIILIPLLALFLAVPAHAGISLGKGGITLDAGETEEMCDVWIYATQAGGNYHVETTGGIIPLTTGISPNDFTLVPIQCPEESNARRACITDLCLSGNQESCKVVCVTFTAPLLMDLNPQEVIYDGAILNSIKIGVATIKEPYSFSVHVRPLDMKPILGVIFGVVIIIILIALFAKKMGKRKKK